MKSNNHQQGFEENTGQETVMIDIHDQTTTQTDLKTNKDLMQHHDEEKVYYDDISEEYLFKKNKVRDDKIEPIVYQWTSIGKNLELFKFLTVAITLALFISSVTILLLINRPFLAYDRSDHSLTKVTSLKIQPQDLKHFIHTFVEKRYTWTEFDPQKLVYSLRPMITKRLSQDLLKYLGKDKANNKKGETLEQYVTRIKPVVTESASFAVFDRIIRVNDIPIIVPVQLQLNIIQGRKTRLNPFGFYVDKLTEYSK